MSVTLKQCSMHLCQCENEAVSVLTIRLSHVFSTPPNYPVSQEQHLGLEKSMALNPLARREMTAGSPPPPLTLTRH